MPTNAGVETAAVWAGWSAGAITVATMLIRFLMKTFRTDRLESITVDADTGTYVRLQQEITRLEAIIQNQQQQIDAFDRKLDRSRSAELEDVADLAMLTILLHQMPCGRCAQPDNCFTQAQAIMTRIADRRREIKESSKEA